MAHDTLSGASDKTPRPGLARARRRAGYNQQMFADELDVTKHTVSQWETGATGINPRRRVAMALLLGISLRELDRLVDGAPHTEMLGSRHTTGHQAALQPRARQQAVILVCLDRQRPGPYQIRLTWPIRATNEPR